MYIELHARSAFSFLEGASLPEEMMAVCAHFQMPAMALLDTDGVYGAPRFHLAAKKVKLKAHIGAEVVDKFVLLPRSHGASQRMKHSPQIFEGFPGSQSTVKNQPLAIPL